MTELKVDPRQVAMVLLWIVMILSLLNGALLSLYFYFGESALDDFIEYFDFGIEGNIPTLYSAVALLICSALLALIVRLNWHRPGGRRGQWLGLSVIFLFLALDEGTAIHENLSDLLELYMPAEGPLYFLWVIPYGIASLVLALIYVRFVLGLPRLTRLRFIFAGSLFLAGAIGVEMLGAMAADDAGYDTVLYTVLYSVEELFEMLGIVLFIYALLSYLAEETGGLVIRLSR